MNKREAAAQYQTHAVLILLAMVLLFAAGIWISTALGEVAGTVVGVAWLSTLWVIWRALRYRP